MRHESGTDGSAEPNISEFSRRVRAAVFERRSWHERRTPNMSGFSLRLPRIGKAFGTVGSKSEYSLSELLSRSDEDFVRAAYRAVLAREPQVDALKRCLHALRTGRLSKIEVLGRMRFSKEGRARKVRIRGLLPRLAVDTALRVPGIGYVAAIGVQCLKLPKLVVRMDRFEFNVANELKAIRASFDELASILEKELNGSLPTVGHEIERLFLACNQRLFLLQDTALRLAQVEERKIDMSQLQALSSKVAMLSEQKIDMSQLQALSSKVAMLSEQITQADRDARVASDKLSVLDRQCIDTRRAAVALERQMERFTESASTPSDGTAGTSVPGHHTSSHTLDALYAAFEERFRGSRELIRKRAEAYLPLIRGANAGSSVAPVVDVGCGRGEWLELLRDSGLNAIGVDSNLVMVQQCRDAELNIVEGDALAYLRGLPAGTVGAVTALHIIEHLPFPTLVELFDQCVRVLRSGGIAIFETPNPENLLVGACNFYYDPTHLHPLPPPMMQFLAEARGFSRAETRGMTEHRGGNKLVPAEGLLNELFGKPLDYALIAYKD